MYVLWAVQCGSVEIPRSKYLIRIIRVFGLSVLHYAFVLTTTSDGETGYGLPSLTRHNVCASRDDTLKINI